MNGKFSVWKRLTAWMLVMAMLVQSCVAVAAEDVAIVIPEETVCATEQSVVDEFTAEDFEDIDPVDSEVQDTDEDTSSEEVVVDEAAIETPVDTTESEEKSNSAADEEGTASQEVPESLTDEVILEAVAQVDQVPLAAAADETAESEEESEDESDTDSWRNTEVGKKICEKADELNDTVLFASIADGSYYSAGACWPAVGSTISTNVGDKRTTILFFGYAKKTASNFNLVNWKNESKSGRAIVSVEFSEPGIVEVVSETSNANRFTFEAVGVGTTTATITYSYNSRNDDTYGPAFAGTYEYTFQVGPEREHAKAGEPYTLTGGASLEELRKGISEKSSSTGMQWWANQVTSEDGYDLWTAERLDTNESSVLTFTPKVIQSDDGNTDYTEYTIKNGIGRSFNYILYAKKYSSLTDWTPKSAQNESFATSSYYDEFTVIVDPYESGLHLMSDSTMIFASDSEAPVKMSAHAYKDSTRVFDGISYSSSASAVASIDGDGYVTPKQVGTAKVTASFGTETVSADVYVKGIYVSDNTVRLSTMPGENTKQLTTMLVGDAGEVDFSKATITSNKPGVANMDTTGLITANSPGSTTITVSWGDYSEYITVEVEGSASLTLDEYSKTLKVGDTATFKATATGDGNEADDAEVAWTSSNTEVATVDESTGEVTAKGLGSTVIRASWVYDGQNYSNEATVTVVRHGLYLSVDKATVEAGGIYNILAVAYEMGEQISVSDLNSTITWSSADEEAATVALYKSGFTGGSVTGIAEGTSVITASWTDAAESVYTASADVTVESNEGYAIANINENPDLTIQGGEGEDHYWAARAINETSVSGKIKITNNGSSAVVTGVLPSAGEWVNVVHEYDTYMECLGRYASTYEQFKVQVNAADGLYLDTYEISKNVGLQEIVRYTYCKNNEVSKPPVVFTADDEEIVELTTDRDMGYCTIKMLKPGTTTVRAAYGSYEREIKITSIGDNGVYVDPEKVTLLPGEEASATAEVWYEGVKQSSASIAWSSSDTDVATVDANGTITGKDAGRAQIYATWDNNGDKYATSVSVFVRKVKDVTVTKVWDDADNWDGIRTEEVQVQLSNDEGAIGEAVVLNENNNWTYTWRGLVCYQSTTNNSGTEYTYQVEETVVPDGYTAELSGNAASGYKITNTHSPETTDVNVAINWDDAENQDGVRPTTVLVQFYANGEEYGEKTVVEAANDWAYTKAVYKNKDQQAVEWTVAAVNVPDGYEAEVTGNMTDGYVITYKHAPAVMNITVNAPNWIDENDQDGIRPDSLIVTLYKNGEATETALTLELQEDGTWTTGVFENVPVYYMEGTEITYTVKGSVDATRYTEQVEGTAKDGFTLTYRHTPGIINVPVTKVWDDAENQDGIRPDSVDVRLYADGVAQNKMITLTAEEGWTGAFTDLDEKKDGQAINYSVKELNVKSGYEAEYEGSVQEGYIITNTHAPETAQISVKNTWDDADNQDGKRPSELTVELYADGEATGKTVKLNASNSWSASFTADKYKEQGTEIVYTVKEVIVPSGYNVTVNETAAGTFALTNKHTPEKIAVAVKSVWSDYNNEDGVRPSSLTVELYANNAATGSKAVLNAANKWTASVQVDKYYNGGKEVAYKAVVSQSVSGYTFTASGGATQGLTVTGSHTLKAKTLTLKLSSTSYEYDGKEKKPSVTVTVGSKTLSSSDYTVSYSNNIKVGTATVLVKGKAGTVYETSSATAQFKITEESLKVKLKKTSYTYTGKAIKPAVTVYKGTTKLNKKYYSVTYKANKKVGTATVVVKGKGKYKKYQGTATFTINLAKMAKPTLKSTKSGTVTVKWKRSKQAAGYEVQFSTNKKFTAGLVKKTVKGSSKVTLTQKSLKKNKTYYVRIRCYKKVGSTTFYSPWSKTAKIKVKK